MTDQHYSHFYSLLESRSAGHNGHQPSTVLSKLGTGVLTKSDWTGLDEDEDTHVWEDNWDDDNVEDDFSNQLRAELEKHGYKMETS
uniref:26S proteasome complex subunit SEM1 n=2 Tax=Xenopus tropicalis TaxID=8364 RepID=A0A803JXE8_XENTR